MNTSQYIPEQFVEKVKDAAVLEDVIGDEVDLRKQGSALVGDCPCCGGKKKLNVSPSKKIWKCFRCDVGGKDAVSFLMEVNGYTFPETIRILADRYKIIIETEQPKTKKKKGRPHNRAVKFRDLQLKESGLSNKSQIYYLKKNDKNNSSYQMDRYQAATIDKAWNVVSGDDMVLHYLDLNWHPIMYLTPKKKRMPFIRVRWSNPSLHKDKNGKPAKYKSPWKSGNHLWLPNAVIDAYQKAHLIETLYIIEGEKKASKMCAEGMMTVGTSGIHNFAGRNEMPHQLQLLIKKCGIKKVVFVLDADWQNITIKNLEKSVDQRPKTFFSAIKKFRDYFYAYVNEGIELSIYFAYGKELVYKGMDDLLVRNFKNKEERAKLKTDFEQAMIDREGEGEYVNVHNITTLSEYKLKEFWHLQGRPAFFKQHTEQLKKLPYFKYGQLKYRWEEEEESFELIQKLLPQEQYWRVEESETRSGNVKKTHVFDYVNILEFLKNRGFGLYEASPNNYRYVHIDNKVVHEVTHHKIQRFVLDFTRELDHSKPIVELLLRGGKQYLGPDKLSQMYYKQPDFNESDPDTQYLYFKNCYWKITKDKIEQRDLKDLPKHVWKDKIIDFEPKYLGHPLMDVGRKDKQWKVKQAAEFKQCEMGQFYLKSSWFNWRNSQELHTDDEGRKSYVVRDKPLPETPAERQLTAANLVSKMIAAGYVLHDYRNWGRMKAIVCMDGLESEIGKSMGGTGKSIWGKQFKHLVPMEVLDGKKSKIEDDSHLYEAVDERTSAILFDDVRVNFNFEFLFSHITTGIKVNPKGEKRFDVLPPKFIITTNHALNGEGSSYDRRQYVLSFSDYFNRERTVGDEFGGQFFHEWDNVQWNLFYNWMATCIQTYLRYGMNYEIPKQALTRRKLRQKIGEKFLDWATLMYSPEGGVFLNRKVEKEYACEKYLQAYSTERKYVDVRKFKEKLLLFAEYAGYEINPIQAGKDGRIKSNGQEYFIVASDKFQANEMTTINNDNQLNSPFNQF